MLLKVGWECDGWFVSFKKSEAKKTTTTFPQFLMV
jgi:hypothetical protein